MIIKIDPTHPDPVAIQKVASILKSGGVIAYPTETFYGLGAEACNLEAVEKIFSIKGRDFQNPIPVIIGDRGQLPQWVLHIPDLAEKLIEKFWPGPLTLVFQASSLLPPRLTAGTGKIGIRVSNARLATALAGSISCPLTSTSANLSGAAECIRIDEILDQLGNRVDAIVDGGATPGGKGSTIIDVTCEPIKILREGAIPTSLIYEII
jgi:L-threonylcarbamoyladenylate synthase